MAEVLHVKKKSDWKKIDFNAKSFSKNDLDGLISFEELTDYELVTQNEPSGESVRKRKPPNSKNEKDSDSKAEKKTKKKKKKKITETKPNVENDIEPVDCTDTNIKEEKTKNRDKNKKDKLKKKKGKGFVLEKKKTAIEDINATLEAAPTMEWGMKAKGKKRKNKDDKSSANPSKKLKPQKEETVPDNDDNQDSDIELDIVTRSTDGMEAWKNMYVPEEVLWALNDKGFREPTPIQAQVLPSAIRDHMDILGAAQTGSGKTLAFGIPVLHYILERKKRGDYIDDISDTEDVDDNEFEENDDDDAADGLEDDDNDDDADDDLDIEDDDTDGAEDDDDDGEDNQSGTDNDQESDEGELSGDELQETSGMGCVKVIDNVEFDWLESDMPPLATPTLVKTHPLALILEPTRELAIQVKNHIQAAAKYTDVRVAVIVGGLAPQKQRRILRKCPDIIVATPGRLWQLMEEGETYLSEIEKVQHLVVDEADRMVEKGHFEELTKILVKLNKTPSLRSRRHTYVFSATLTLLHSGPQRMMKKVKKVKINENQKLELLVKSIGLKDKPKIVDLTRKMGTVDTLTEARINCTKEEKDMYLYYFLKQYPGRTLVFTNSKDCIRRLISIFTLLQFNILPLHADMHQKQRLKNLEKFTADPRGLLLASDVAARGLDIPNVQHVIHYQVPHTVENYVHRSGRTARAYKEGLSVMIIGPEDLKNYRKIINTLNKNEDLPMFPVEHEYMSEIRRRVGMVRQIETQDYRFNKSKRQNDWFTKAAMEIGVDIDDEDLLTDLGNDSEQANHRQYIKQMRSELAILLKQPLVPMAVGGKYPTKTGRLATMPARNVERSAIQNVKKDKKVQDKMLEKVLKKPAPMKKKKDKWKKKWKNT